MFNFGYRVGLPLWRMAAKAGIPMKIKVTVYFDRESGTYWAEGEGLRGLVVTGKDINELHSECVIATAELMQLELNDRIPSMLDMKFPRDEVLA